MLAIGRPVGEVVATGEAEIGMQQIIENQPVQGAHLVGPLAARTWVILSPTVPGLL